MTLSVGELRLVLEAIDMAISRHQSQADFYEARPERYSAALVSKHRDKSAAMHALSCRFSTLRARHDILEVARS